LTFDSATHFKFNNSKSKVFHRQRHKGTRGKRKIVPHILNPEMDGQEWLTSRSFHFILEKETRYQMNRRVSENQRLSGRFE
jgi:hypothetical protein